MKTKLIGIKEFQRRLSQLVKEAQTSKMHFVIMRHSVPVGTFTPFTKKERNEITLEELEKEIAEARKEVKRGEVSSLEEVAKELGIKL